MTIELNTTVAQAEVLFLSFAQLVADVDRRKGEELAVARIGAIRRRGAGISNAEFSIPTLSHNLRELLVNGRT
jgi:TBC1 domain family member 15